VTTRPVDPHNNAKLADPASTEVVRAAIFDMDGVLTDTAGVHAEAWRRMFDQVLPVLSGGAGAVMVFDPVDEYRRLVEGLQARGLSGEGYRGHLFWDEIFVHPILTLRQSAITGRDFSIAVAGWEPRGQLAWEGALFPRQSGSDGRDETPTRLFNPRTRSWQPDNSRRQRHVGLAVAYGIIKYAEAGGDESFLAAAGIDLVVDVAR
jgi:Glycosyl hydrolase family 65 central catalytic domain